MRLGTARVAALTALSTEPPAANETAETRFMKTAEGHCIALDVSPGRYFCNIYEHRPLRCEVYEPGSPSCLAARARPTQNAF